MEGHDLPSLLFAYLDEFLFRFSTEAFVVKRATIFDFQRPQPSSSEGQGRPEREDVEGGAGMAAAAGAYRIRVRAEGEGFDLAKYVKRRLGKVVHAWPLGPGLVLTQVRFLITANSFAGTRKGRRSRPSRSPTCRSTRTKAKRTCM